MGTYMRRGILVKLFNTDDIRCRYCCFWKSENRKDGKGLCEYLDIHVYRKQYCVLNQSICNKIYNWFLTKIKGWFK